MMCQFQFQQSFDKCLGWMRDTGVIKKMRSDAMREYKAGKVRQPQELNRSNRPLSLMRWVMSLLLEQVYWRQHLSVLNDHNQLTTCTDLIARGFCRRGTIVQSAFSACLWPSFPATSNLPLQQNHLGIGYVTTCNALICKIVTILRPLVGGIPCITVCFHNGETNGYKNRQWKRHLPSNQQKDPDKSDKGGYSSMEAKKGVS